MNLKNTALLGMSVVEYWLHYFSCRRFPKKQEFYVVYTNLDHRIAFEPNCSLDYWLVNTKFLPIAVQLGRVRESFNRFRHIYESIAREGSRAFRAVPTIMPHFTEHRSSALHITQALLKPINCCPSLHTATPFLAYNLGAKYFPEKEPQLRQMVGNVVQTVIKTKSHALIDVAFGILLSKRGIQAQLNLDFCDLEYFFTHEQTTKDGIPYEQVYRIYHEIDELAGEDSLPEIMRHYFQGIGLPLVRREQSNCFYDLERKLRVYSPELKVGRGIF